jgi:hypothetical protein
MVANDGGPTYIQQQPHMIAPQQLQQMQQHQQQQYVMPPPQAHMSMYSSPSPPQGHHELHTTMPQTQPQELKGQMTGTSIGNYTHSGTESVSGDTAVSYHQPSHTHNT